MLLSVSGDGHVNVGHRNSLPLSSPAAPTAPDAFQTGINATVVSRNVDGVARRRKCKNHPGVYAQVTSGIFTYNLCSHELLADLPTSPVTYREQPSV